MPQRTKRADSSVESGTHVHVLRKAVRIILPWLRRYWFQGVVLFILSIIVSALSLLNPLLIKFFIDDILLKKQLDLLGIFALVYGGILFMTIVMRVVQHYANRQLQLKISFQVRKALFEHMERLSLQAFKRFSLGNLLLNLSQDAVAFEGVFQIFIGLILNTAAIVIILGFLFLLQWKLALVVVSVLPLYVLSERFAVQRVRRLYQSMRSLFGGLLTFFEEKLSGIVMVKLFGREAYEANREQRMAGEIVKIDLRATLANDMASGLVGIVTAIVLLLVLVMGGLLVINDTLTIGGLMAFYAYMGGLFSPLEYLANFWRDLQAPLTSMLRVDRLLKAETRPSEKRGTRPLLTLRGDVAFEQVGFSYDDHLVLKNISFQVDAGQHVGVVGPSGSGKTTMAFLLMKLLEPTQGRILLDGKDTRKLAAASIAEFVGYLPQEPVLFSGSIAENIAYAKDRATKAEIHEAARRAGVDRFTGHLPKQYETKLDPGGKGLSSGERQRIALARLFLKNPALVILDEPSAFLDSITETFVRDEFAKFFRQRTYFVITHRLEAIEKLDRILVLDDHRLVEDGTFEDLMKSKGTFFQLYAGQHDARQ